MNEEHVRAMLIGDITTLARVLRRMPLLANYQRSCPVVAIIGPTSSGKSKLISGLEAQGLDTQMVFLPEVYTSLHTEGRLVPPPLNISKSLGEVWTLKNQCLVMVEQFIKEAELAGQAAWNNNKILVVERMITESAVIMPGGWEQLMTFIGESTGDLFERYDLVIDLQPPPEEVYHLDHGKTPMTWHKYHASVARHARHLDLIRERSHLEIKSISYSGVWAGKLNAAADTILRHTFAPRSQ